MIREKITIFQHWKIFTFFISFRIRLNSYLLDSFIFPPNRLPLHSFIFTSALHWRADERSYSVSSFVPKKSFHIFLLLLLLLIVITIVILSLVFLQMVFFISSKHIKTMLKVLKCRKKICLHHTV